MDAPPAQEDCGRFVEVCGQLEAMGLNVPRVIEADMDRGFLLLTDLGELQYLERLTSDPSSADTLYRDALGALSTMQRRGSAYQASLPTYDTDLLQFELSLFRDWLCGTQLQLRLSDDEEAAWRECCDLLTDNALRQPQVFVHRDYHSRNLMVTEFDNPGILDFQDAVEGPLTYDLVSLLRDCYVRWPAGRVVEWAMQFYEGLDSAVQLAVSERRFMRFFDLLGVQRHLKAAGIFCRLNHRDGKSAYLRDVPAALSYVIDIGRNYSELDFVVDLVERRVLPVWDERL